MTEASSQKDERLRVFAQHELRQAVLGEIHARPFRPVSAPRTILHMAFMTDAKASAADVLRLAEMCEGEGCAGPGKAARYHSFPLAGGTLSWERHAEFTNYTWEGPLAGPMPFARSVANHPFGSRFEAPGPLIVATRLDLIEEEEAGDQWQELFDPASLTALQIDGGVAVAATDFRQDGNGMTRILVMNRAMTRLQAGATVQRLLEIETYRTLTILGLMAANEISPEVGTIEDELVDLTRRMQDTSGLEANRGLLEELSRLAAVLEAGAAASSYRFGASRAYAGIVAERLETLAGASVPGVLNLASFLRRRLAPAMRTCQAVEDRQANLSRKLARATTLLRTRVDVDLEQQNRGLLESMNRRARLQLRLQQTVEGLSVAAVSYYVVGLIGYLAKGAKEVGLPVPPSNITTALAVPVIVLVIWYLVKRIRSHHAERDDG